MAEAFFNKYAKNATAYSAGSAPAENIDPKTVEVMRENGIDLANKKTTSFDSLPVGNFDFILTMGCRDACPITPKEKTIKWDFEDPKGHPIQKYRDVRDLIETKIKRLVEQLEMND